VYSTTVSPGEIKPSLVPPGHTPMHFAGAEIVEFSPTNALGETIGVVLENLRAAEPSTAS